MKRLNAKARILASWISVLAAMQCAAPPGQALIIIRNRTGAVVPGAIAG
jgi:hypothetical protein